MSDNHGAQSRQIGEFSVHGRQRIPRHLQVLQVGQPGQLVGNLEKEGNERYFFRYSTQQINMFQDVNKR